MNPSGITFPSELMCFRWERCPDRDGRLVFRGESNGSRWIKWQPAPRSKSLSRLETSDKKRTWQSVSMDATRVDFPALNLFYLPDVEGIPDAEGIPVVEGDPHSAWYAVHLGGLEIVDDLVDRFDMPPIDVLRDWAAQIDDALPTRIHSSDLLSHILATPDGRLLSLRAIEGVMNQTSSRHFDSNPEMRLPGFDIEVGGSLLGARSKAQLTLGELLQKGSSKKPTLPILVSPSLSNTPSKISVKRNTTNRSSKNQRNPRLLGYSAVVAGTLVVALLYLRSSSQSNLFVAAERIDSLKVPIKLGQTQESGSEFVASDKELVTPLEITHNDPTLPNDQLSNQANDSLQNLLSRFSGGAAVADSNDSISFESIEAFIRKKDGGATIQPATESSDGDFTKPILTTPPFSESLDAANPDQTMEASAMAPEVAKSDNEVAEQGIFEHSIPLQQAQSKQTIRVPFKPNERQAVCRARLRIAQDVLQKPVEAVKLVGRQDTVWTVALKDDSVSLLVYLRTKPSRSWYIATTVRVKLGPESEFPIGPRDATQVCLRLQNYTRWLEQNRLLCESMRSNSKTRSMALAGLDEIDKRIKATQKSLETWINIEELVRVFYRENALELELASSTELLQPLAEP